MIFEQFQSHKPIFLKPEWSHLSPDGVVAIIKSFIWYVAVQKLCLDSFKEVFFSF